MAAAQQSQASNLTVTIFIGDHQTGKSFFPLPLFMEWEIAILVLNSVMMILILSLSVA
jgi:hypothetical protein